MTTNKQQNQATETRNGSFPTSTPIFVQTSKHHRERKHNNGFLDFVRSKKRKRKEGGKRQKKREKKNIHSFRLMRREGEARVKGKLITTRFKSKRGTDFGL